MPLHHYIPAAYLGGFSASEDGPRRSRPIWCLRRGAHASFRTAPSRVGAVNGLYTLHQSWEPDTLDEVWSFYERQLPRAIQSLMTDPMTLSASAWLRVLVPFVTSLFVRGREFGERYTRRDVELTTTLKAAGRLSEDHVNGGRVVEFQRLLAPVTAANWTLLRVEDPSVSFITSELGLTLVRHAAGAKEPGYAVPLTPELAVMITPQQLRPIMSHLDGSWWPLIGQLAVTAADVTAINVSTASFSNEFLIARERRDLEAFAKEWHGPPDEDWLTDGWTGTREEKVAHEFDWHRLAGLVDKPFSGELDLQDVDFSGDSGWCPPLIFPTNLPWFRSGLHLRGNVMFLELGPRDGFPT